MKAIKAFPIPKSRKEIKSFLGLLGYYRKFIRDFAKLTKPLSQKLKGKAPIKIEAEFTEAVELCNDPILRYPDFTKPFILTSDASNVAIGAVLSQGNENSDRPVSFASRTLSDTELNYSKKKCWPLSGLLNILDHTYSDKDLKYGQITKL